MLFARWFLLWAMLLAYVLVFAWLSSRALAYRLGDHVSHAKLGVTALALWICLGGAIVLTLVQKP